MPGVLRERRRRGPSCGVADREMHRQRHADSAGSPHPTLTSLAAAVGEGLERLPFPGRRTE